MVFKVVHQTIIIIKMNYFKINIIKRLTTVRIISNKKIHNFQVLLNKKLIFSRGKVALMAIIQIHNHSILKNVQLILLYILTNYKSYYYTN